MESGIGENFAYEFQFWNPEYTSKKFAIPLMIRIQKPCSTDKYGYQVPGIRNPQGGIQNPESKTVMDPLTWGDTGLSVALVLFH